MSEHTATPWAHRPEKYDDWGLIRAADGYPVATADVSARVPDTGPHRVWAKGGFPEPVEVAANAEFICRAANCHDELVAALEKALAVSETYHKTDNAELAAWAKLHDEFVAVIQKAKG